MLKQILWPLIHSFELNPKISFNQWGWMTQQEIKKFKTIKEKKFKIFSNENHQFCKKEFNEGSKIGYKTIYQAYLNKVDFTNYDYTVPELSLALNYLNNDTNLNKISLDNITVKIIDSWIEPGLVKTNSNFLGLWDKRLIKQEIIAGGFGPENIELWDKKPLKQIVRVKYELNDRIDIWDWQRCITISDYNWCVSNINQIIN